VKFLLDLKTKIKIITTKNTPKMTVTFDRVLCRHSIPHTLHHISSTYSEYLKIKNLRVSIIRVSSIKEVGILFSFGPVGVSAYFCDLFVKRPNKRQPVIFHFLSTFWKRKASQKWFMPSLLGRTRNSIQVITELDTVTKRKYHAR